MNAAYFIGEPQQCGFYKVYPPKLKDVLANPDYGVYKAILTISQEDIWDLIAKEQSGANFSAKPVEGAPTPFEFLLNNCYHSEEYMKKAEEAFQFFLHEEVKILPTVKMIVFVSSMSEDMKLEDLKKIDTEEEFFKLQNYIRLAEGEDVKRPPNPNENPRIALIKAKGRWRERLKAKKGNKNSIGFDRMIVALCCMNLGLNPLNIGEISFLACQELFAMAQKKEQYETEIKILTSNPFGSKKKRKPLEHWLYGKDK